MHAHRHMSQIHDGGLWLHHGDGPHPFFFPTEEGIFEVKSTAGDTHLGGEDFHNRRCRGRARANLRRGVLALWVHCFFPYGYDVYNILVLGQ